MRKMNDRPSIFGAPLRTQVLLSIYLMEETHASELARLLGRSLSRIQAQVESLELAGITVSRVEGRNRRVIINPRFAFKEELFSLLQKMAMFDEELQMKLAAKRSRPRREGKQI
jgi:DNA-binding MarR family transcriptional regulator